jgi:hypothetical protein
MAAPHKDKAAPARDTHKTRGRRTFKIIFPVMLPGVGTPRTAFQMEVIVSEKEMLTLPTQMHRIMVNSRATARNR